MLQFHLKQKYGIIQTNGDKITKFQEKKELKEQWMNAGIYFLSKTILKDLPKKGDIEKTTFPKYANSKKLSTVKFTKTIWYSIDSFKDMEDCSKEIKNILK